MNTEETRIALDKITAADFQSIINQQFVFEISPEVSMEAELIEVLVLSNYSPLERSPFSITFRTQQRNEYYPQGIFTIHHPVLKSLAIFLSPKGFDGIGMRYEAIFS